MELIKKNIHMERVKCRASTQLTLEEDMNISDQKPDAAGIITQKGKIVVEEIHPMTDYVMVKGSLRYSILYLTDENEKRPCALEGRLAFEEKIHLEGVTANDTVQIRTKLEDMNVGLINSRKISIRALLNAEVFVDELYDEEAIVEIVNSGPLEILKKPMRATVLTVDTKDIFRIKEEIELPAGMPNFFDVIWKDVKILGLEFKPLEDKISLQGEISGFFLYEGEGEERPIRYYEVSRPFNGSFDVAGCSENMILDVAWEMEHEDFEVRPDYDGEERILQLDMALNLSIRLLETQELLVITDVYGILQDMEPVMKEGSCRNLLQKNTGKLKVADTLRISSHNPNIFQVCHTTGEILTETKELAENGVDLSGVLLVKVLYVTGDDENPYACQEGTLPFAYHLDMAGVTKECTLQVIPQIEQLTAAMADARELEIKGLLSFSTIVFQGEKEPMLSDIAIMDAGMSDKKDMPGMVVYIARENDNIWNVGKKYYVPMKSIREVNHLKKDELEAGEKILVIKEMV